METITIGIAIGLILAVSGAVWRLAIYLRTIEKELTNDTRHSLNRIEKKVDGLEKHIHKINVDIASCPLKRFTDE